MMASSKVGKQIKETIGNVFNQRQPQEWFEDESDYSDTKDEDEQPQKVPKFPEWFKDDSGNEEEEPHSSSGPVEKGPTQSVKTPSAASHTPATSCTFILISAVRKGKQCKLKASGETDKFCHLRKRQIWCRKDWPKCSSTGDIKGDALFKQVTQMYKCHCKTLINTPEQYISSELNNQGKN